MEFVLFHLRWRKKVQNQIDKSQHRDSGVPLQQHSGKKKKKKGIRTFSAAKLLYPAHSQARLQQKEQFLACRCGAQRNFKIPF
jgi:hypothetical protein